MASEKSVAAEIEAVRQKGPQRVLVCGGRDFTDKGAIVRALAPYKPVPWNAVSEHIVIHGGCPTGADKLADEWCAVYGVRKRVYLADWSKHGRAAGPIRNQRMIDEGRPDLVLAFPGGRGTTDMVRRASAAGIEVREIAALAPNSTEGRSDRG
ncbi:SLOG family protein [Methylobacterium sp. R2-1]|uniref:SLOG family protein n=1 Tax=Methylobacterium sp. R2-1 TaxID=2587064 RepID=UPI001607FAE7|nr:SLOG family protein [Methylobacterium sp. R2-1]MBB2962906.1 hypothetical protein [Methylobacterium sp. R2-1]